jgi:hypothetical protein
MPLPGVSINVQDGNLGVLPALGEGVHVKVGVAQQGPVNQVLAITSTKQAKEVFGGGPLPEAIAVAIAQGAGLVYAVRANAGVAGTIGTVQKTGTGTGNLSAAGSPNDAYEVVVRITRAGGRGTAAFIYSLDGGDTYSPEIAVPSGGTYALPGTDITLTFTNGASGTSFEVGDTYTFTTTAPAYSLADLNAAINALFAQAQLRYQFVHVVGAATPTVAAAVDARMGEAAQAHRYIWAMLEAQDQRRQRACAPPGPTSRVRPGGRGGGLRRGGESSHGPRPTQAHHLALGRAPGGQACPGGRGPGGLRPPGGRGAAQPGRVRDP